MMMHGLAKLKKKNNDNNNKFRVFKNPLLAFIPKQLNPDHNLQICFFEISFYFILASTP